MEGLIESILTEEIPKKENPKIREIIEFLSRSDEKGFTVFENEFEEIGKRLSIDKMNRTQELFEFICIEVDKAKKRGKLPLKSNVIKYFKMIPLFIFLHRLNLN